MNNTTEAPAGTRTYAAHIALLTLWSVILVWSVWLLWAYGTI